MIANDKRILSNIIPLNEIPYLTLVLLLFTGIAFGNDDVVIFNNGDRLTGEVKSLERGRLRFKTDATDTINIEWDNVAYLSSDQNIQVETVQGLRYLGHLGESEKRKTLVVQSDVESVELSNIRVIKMSPIEKKGVNRLDGDITAGYNFAKANEVEQLNLGIDLKFRTETRILSLGWDSVLTDSLDNDANQRENLDLGYTRLLPNRWLLGGNIALTRNDELGIDLRTSLGGGGGRIVRQSDHSSVILQGGLMYTREDLAESDVDQESIEAFGTVSWDWFRFDSPELDLSTSLQVIPNLTDTGRVRSELDIKLRWEMIEDLFWELSYYHSYDNRPPTPIKPEIPLPVPEDENNKSDYGIVTSIGYKF